MTAMGCLPLGKCGCPCHHTAGVKHVVACCDAPPYREDRINTTRDELLRNLVATDPIINHMGEDDGYTGPAYVCPWCGPRSWRFGPVEHDSECPWRLAAEYIGGFPSTV